MRPEFTKSMIAKAEKLISLGLVRYEGQGLWVVRPIAGYNITTHRVRSGGDFGFSCDCQWYAIKSAQYRNLSSHTWPVCAHICAVKMFEDDRRQKQKLDTLNDVNQQKFDFAGV